MKNICIITGSRAEYGILSHLMRLIKNDGELRLQVIVTNMHLSPEFGNTYQEIEADGFSIDKKVQMLLSSDTPNATAKSVGLGTIGFADAYEDLKPDLILVLGDRFEILSAVTVALFYKIPVAHLHGGEVTEGAFDDAIRHAITKMSHLHFTATEKYKQRVIQLGENPQNVYNFGSLGVDNIRHIKLLTKVDLERSISFLITNKTILVTYHPVTLDEEPLEQQINNLLDTLNKYKELRIIFTLSNSDIGNHVITDKITDFVNKNISRACVFKSLGKLRYLSTLQYICAVVGNSSSGIIEVPSFGKPTLNIGSRQKGRVYAQSVVNCGTNQVEIEIGLKQVLDLSKSKLDIDNPYESQNTAQNILSVIKKYTSFRLLTNKVFYDQTGY